LCLQTFIVKLKYDDNIQALRKCIDAHRAQAGMPAVQYEIRTAYPSKVSGLHTLTHKDIREDSGLHTHTHTRTQTLER
jgi:hypothetical protein